MSLPEKTTHPIHLLGVWNPSYDADAMTAHLEVLLRHARAHRAGECDEEEVYVWWGKVRSSNRQQPLEHLPQILALDTALQSESASELHLYLTDYRSLYVAQSCAIIASVPRCGVPSIRRRGRSSRRPSRSFGRTIAMRRPTCHRWR